MFERVISQGKSHIVISTQWSLQNENVVLSLVPWKILNRSTEYFGQFQISFPRGERKSGQSILSKQFSNNNL